MRVESVAKLTDLSSWRLVYDDCGHVQEFANEGLADLEHVALYTRRHFAHCLTCASPSHQATRQPQQPAVDRQRSRDRPEVLAGESIVIGRACLS